MDESQSQSKGFSGQLTILGAVVGILVGLATLAKNWNEFFPPKLRPQAGLTVMVAPSKVEMRANGSAKVTWTLAETNNVGIHITSRTGEWRTISDKVVKTIGPNQTTWRIVPFGRREWTNDIILYEDVANEATDGVLILDQAFQGQDDNGNNVTGKARIRVQVTHEAIR